VKLLFDENLSRRLVTHLADAFPDSSHVTAVGLEHATDREVWEYARSHGFVLVSKDSDFNDLAFVNGPPPKVIWLRVGNTPTNDIAQLLAAAADTITAFIDDEHDAVLTLRAPPHRPTSTPDDPDSKRPPTPAVGRTERTTA
jgi:predicted nuclease of predicted toxin-antitoxin system